MQGGGPPRPPGGHGPHNGGGYGGPPGYNQGGFFPGAPPPRGMWGAGPGMGRGMGPGQGGPGPGVPGWGGGVMGPGMGRGMGPGMGLGMGPGMGHAGPGWGGRPGMGMGGGHGMGMGMGGIGINNQQGMANRGGVAGGPVMGTGAPRPPPTRLPPNLPALQRMGTPGSSGEPSPKGPGRGSDSGGSKKSYSRFSSPVSLDSSSRDTGSISINVYVGKLKPEVDNFLVEDLLACCGRVDKWNRAVDPSTDLPKAFGFCTYRTAQAAAVSVQVLNDLELAGQAILVKVGKKEQPSLEAFLSPKDEEAAKKHQALLDTVKAKIQNVLFRHGERSGPEGAAANDGGNPSSGRISPSASTGRSPSRDGKDASSRGKHEDGDGDSGGAQPAATKPKPKKDWVRFDGAAMLLSSAGWSDDEDEEKEELITSEIEKFRQKQAERDKKLEDERRQELQRKIKEAQRREKQKEEDAKEKDKIARDREAREMVAMAAMQSRESKEKGNLGDRGSGGRSSVDRDRESERRRGRSRSRSRSRSRERERKRGRRDRSSDRDRERSSDRDRERSSDRYRDGDRDRERDRVRDRDNEDRNRDRGDRGAVDKERNGRAERNRDLGREEMDAKRAARAKLAEEEMHKRRLAVLSALETASHDDDDDEYADGAADREVRERAGGRFGSVRRDGAGARSSEGNGAASGVVNERQREEMRRRRAVLAALGEDVPDSEDEQEQEGEQEKPSEEEAGTAAAAETVEDDAEANTEAEEPKLPAVVEKKGKARDKELVGSIPKDREELFAYEINWHVVEAHNIIQSKMRPWIVKKIIEYLGEEEKTLTEFILTKLGQRAPPQTILDELKLVLEEDAAVFMTKMWRMLVFCTLRVQERA